MKSILYAGAALMIGASIYGFVDYKKNSHKKEFNDLYAEKKTTKPVEVKEKKVTPDVNNKVVEEKKTQKKTAVVKNKAVTEEKKEIKKKKRRFSAEDFSRAPLREEVEEITLPSKKDIKKENKEL